MFAPILWCPKLIKRFEQVGATNAYCFWSWKNVTMTIKNMRQYMYVQVVNSHEVTNMHVTDGWIDQITIVKKLTKVAGIGIVDAAGADDFIRLPEDHKEQVTQEKLKYNKLILHNWIIQ